ncbi:MAG: fumarate hydrolyase [Chloroflexi bacterium]|nr:fumarate hydrolyase [Chloroflexota bacterium]
MHKLTVPASDEAIKELKAGDPILLSGVIVTGRDAAHKLMIEKFIRSDAIPADEAEFYGELRQYLDCGIIYHCGPVVRQDEDGKWSFVAAGPTTSIREEVYQPEVIEHFNLKGVIGKGGMGPNTLQACVDYTAVYLHAIGGAASLIAQSVKEVIGVYKLKELGVPEAFWVIRVEDFPMVVTMDSHGNSIHEKIAAKSQEKFARVVGA